MQSVILKGEITAFIEKFSLEGYTYSGLYEGTVDKRVNQFLLEDFFEDFEQIVHIIHPSEEEMHHELPPVVYYVELRSYEPVQDPESDGSSLKIMWLEEEPDNKMIQEIVQNGVANVDWKKYAVDYYY